MEDADYSATAQDVMAPPTGRAGRNPCGITKSPYPRRRARDSFGEMRACSLVLNRRPLGTIAIVVVGTYVIDPGAETITFESYAAAAASLSALSRAVTAGGSGGSP
jgi:hypothetical protein